MHRVVLILILWSFFGSVSCLTSTTKNLRKEISNEVGPPLRDPNPLEVLGEPQDLEILESSEKNGAYGGLYRTQSVIKMDLKMLGDDWEKLRSQQPQYPCLPDVEKNNHGYTPFPADITINGENVANIGLRKRSHCGSQSPIKPGLSIKFDQYKKGQKYKETNSLTLNNSHQDPSFIRQCLAGFLLRKWGLAYQMCNFVKVRLNGADVGTYINIEPIKKTFTGRYFPGKKVYIFEGGSPGADLTPEGVSALEPKDDGVDTQSIRKIVDGIHNGGASGSLDQYLDSDDFIGFWAAELIMNHWDGYSRSANNFYLIQGTEDQKFRFVVSGTDQVFQSPLSGGISDFGKSYVARSLLQNPNVKEKLKSQILQNLQTVPVTMLKAYADALMSVVLPHLNPAEAEVARKESKILRDSFELIYKTIELEAAKL